MPDSMPEIMTITETSEYLRIPLSSLYKLAQAGKIPGQKVGRQWRFRREAIDCWLEKNPFQKTVLETTKGLYDPDLDSKQAILSLRLLIARAAQKDSLNWWEDDSLTQAGGYLLERLFLANPGEAGRKLALEAAKTRYQAAFNGNDDALHLFRLDNTGEVEYGLQGVRLDNIQVPQEPITTIDAFRQKLLELTGQSSKYQITGVRANHRLEIDINSQTGKPSILEIVKTLAWASLEGKPGQPFFPYTTQSL